MRCPQCRGHMDEGYMSTGGGLNWFRRLESSNVDFAEGIPGTFTWFRWHRLKAYRCRACQIILFHYGDRVRERPKKRFEGESDIDAAT